MKDQKNNKLKPYISRPGAWALSLGTILGWGLAVITSNTYLAEAGPLGSTLGLLAGAVIMFIISRNYHYMMNNIPDPGGAYAFAKETFGYDHGFLSAWFLALTYIAMFWANVTAIPLFLSYFFKDIFRFGFHYTIFGYDVYMGETILTIAVILLVTIICTNLKRPLIALMIVLCIIFTAGVLICFGCSFFARGEQFRSISPLFLPDRSALSQMIRIVVISPWAYIGYENISHSSEEFTFPVKHSSVILTTAIITSAVLYISVIFMSVSAYPPEYGSWLEYNRDTANLSGIKALPAFYAAQHYMGSTGVYIMVTTIIALIITSLIGNMIPLSRLLYAMAKDDIIPRRFARVNSNGIPSRAMWLVAAVSFVIPFLGRSAIGWIVDVTTIGATIIFGFVSVSAWKMARSRGDKTYMYTGMAGLVFMAAFALYLLLFNLISSKSMEAESYFLFTVWTVLGFVFFLNLLKKDQRKIFGKSTIVWVSLLLLVLFTSLVWMSQSSMDFTSDALNDVRSHYSTTAAANDSSFMELKMHALRQANVRSMFVVIILFAISLGIHLLLQKQHQALERDKMRAEEESRAKSRFMFNMSHDIRTPMNAIIGFTHLARQDGVSVSEKNAYLDKIDASSKQLLSIINDILDMSRIENGKIELNPEPTDIEAVIDDICDLFTVQMNEKNIHFECNHSDIRNKWVICDRNRLSRVLLNLLSNAHKFTPPGGRVSLTAAQSSEDNGTAVYEIRVKDSGIGMGEEFMDNLFNAFERERTSTVSKLQGTGLGLSITKGIVDMMNGTIDVISEPDKGSEFIVTLTLPLTEAHEAQTSQSDRPKRIDLSSKRLLVVEDNAVNMEIACMILSQHGFRLERADDGKVALEMVSDSPHGYYDAILMDIQMPVMNGYEATRAIRALPDKALANIPIIAMTANVFQEDVQAAKNAGMNGHIAKPLDIDVMMDTITSVLLQSDRGSAAEQN